MKKKSFDSVKMKREIRDGLNKNFVNADFKEQKCPQCKEGDLILRKSIYGQFVACKRYPKCRYIKKGEKNEKENHKQDSK